MSEWRSGQPITTLNYTYDDSYQLTGESRSDGGGITSTTWLYDKAGNRLRQAVQGSTISQTNNYTYNDLDQLTNAVIGGGSGNSTSNAYSYDGRGNLTTITAPTGVTSYNYDAVNRLKGVVLPGAGGSATYHYDYAGRRVREQVGISVTNYLWDEGSAYGDVLLESDGSGTTLASYMLAGGELLVQKKLISGSNTTGYFLMDGQGSVRSLTSSGGNLVQSYSYDAFGELRSAPTSLNTRYLYTGQQFDQLSGLYSLRARYYTPGNGRFLNRDTYPVNFNNPIELNRYGYTANNPINFVDPTGLFVQTPPEPPAPPTPEKTSRGSASDYATLITNISFSPPTVASLALTGCQVSRMISDVAGAFGADLIDLGTESLFGQLCVRVSYVADTNIFGDSTAERAVIDAHYLSNPNVVLYVPFAVYQELLNSPRVSEMMRATGLAFPLGATIRPIADGDITGINISGGFGIFDAKIVTAAVMRGLPLLTTNDQGMYRQINNGDPTRVRLKPVKLVHPS